MSGASENENHYSWLSIINRLGLICGLVFLAVVAIFAVAIGVVVSMEAYQTGQWTNIASCVILLLAVMVTGVWVFIIYGVIQTLVSSASSVRQTTARLERIETLLEDQCRSTRKLIDLESLSDKAKSLIYRDREIETLREVIHEDLMRQDYETAEKLIEDMTEKFGHIDEADRLRVDLQAAKKATLEEKIDTSIMRIQSIIETHDWPKAIRAAQKLLEVYPDNPRVGLLPERIETERTNHKRQLLQEYGEAVKKNDIDQSIFLLKELDRYLAPQEAAALQDSARGVFKAKLHNLGVQFAIQVTDQRWDMAISTGEEIMRDYPNSRMSQEVRQKISQLRSNAASVTQANSAQ